MDNFGCEYCRGAAYTDKPFKVITQMGREVEVIFNFCPVCGNEIGWPEEERNVDDTN